MMSANESRDEGYAVVPWRQNKEALCITGPCRASNAEL